MNNDGYAGKFQHQRRIDELRGGSDHAAPPIAEELDGEDTLEGDAFTVLSADRHQKIMLELRFKNGNAKALAYSYLVAMDFNPSEAIKMDFGGHEVTISGRKLEPLFAGLVAQRVAIIREMDRLHAEATASKDDTVVSSIQVVESK
jgi:hypothetical protein